tara:strand:- start:418 stop:1098 length:681 start_codon:yes stop_codon:yes gene_type:complete
MEPTHQVCEKCRCNHVAGYGTYGDFYGLGDTGHYGVGYCIWHENDHSHKAHADVYAVNQMKALQQMGRKADGNVEDYLKDTVVEREEALTRTKAREEMELIFETLEEFKRIAGDGELTELARGQSVPISDKSRIELALNIAKTMSGMKLNEFKLDNAEYIHYDELKLRMPMMISCVHRHFEQIREMLIKGEKEAIDIAKESFMKEFKEIWSNTQTGAKSDSTSISS